MTIKTAFDHLSTLNRVRLLLGNQVSDQEALRVIFNRGAVSLDIPVSGVSGTVMNIRGNLFYAHDRHGVSWSSIGCVDLKTAEAFQSALSTATDILQRIQNPAPTRLSIEAFDEFCAWVRASGFTSDADILAGLGVANEPGDEIVDRIDVSEGVGIRVSSHTTHSVRVGTIKVKKGTGLVLD